ncbi:MAG: hypothetical protein AB7S77_15580 [Desulfatirhabdiaceae bacterium]
MMMDRLKIAIYGCASCGGCDESLIDMADGLLDILHRCHVVFWPTALDYRYRDVEQLADKSIDFTFINGAIRDRRDVRMAGLLHQKSKKIIAYGACAQMGGVIGLANFHTVLELMSRLYPEPGGDPDATDTLADRVLPLHQIVVVDATIPGCPPQPDRVYSAIDQLLDKALLPPGHVFADTRALCATCSRRDTLPQKPVIDRFYRIYEKPVDPGRCFLDQGVICLGPSTRGGCNGQCLSANMPCRGCMGPLDGDADGGCRSLSFLAAWIRANDMDGIEAAVSSVPDPAGLFYRYCLADSILPGRCRQENT